MITFKHLGLSEAILRGILDTGYSTPTDIQAAAIPAACAGRDLIGCAQTGTGKTAAFVMPLLNNLSHRSGRGRKPRGLVVTPTRELALQVEEAVRTYGRFTKHRSLAVFGGVSIRPQISKLRQGVDKCADKGAQPQPKTAKPAPKGAEKAEEDTGKKSKQRGRRSGGRSRSQRGGRPAEERGEQTRQPTKSAGQAATKPEASPSQEQAGAKPDKGDGQEQAKRRRSRRRPRRRQNRPKPPEKTS